MVELPAVLVTHLTELIRKHAAEILTRQDVKTLIDNLKKHSPALVEEVTPAVLGTGEIQQVLVNLLNERVSVRDLGSILESLATAARASKESTYLTEQCRLGLSRQICKGLRNAENTIPVITLDPQLEQMLEASLQNTPRGPRLVLRPDLVGMILDAAMRVQEQAVANNEAPVLVCSPNIRFPLKKLLESSVPNMTLLAYSEIAAGINITSIASLSIHEN